MSRPPRPVDPGPRTGMDRLMSWGEANIWGERQPEWYEEPGVWESLSAEDQAILKPHLLAPGRAPVGEMAGVTHLKSAAEAVGRAGQAIGGMFQGKPEPYAAPAPVDMITQTEYKRLSAEQLLIEYLLRDMAPPEPMAAPPPQTWGVQDPAPYSDPYAEQQFQQQRFEEMRKLRRLPVPPGE